MYAVTLLAQGKEIKTLIENDVTFETSSEAYSFMKGKDAGSLEEGDVICLTANVAGTRINHMYFIYRPQDEDFGHFRTFSKTGRTHVTAIGFSLISTVIQITMTVFGTKAGRVISIL